VIRQRLLVVLAVIVLLQSGGELRGTRAHALEGEKRPLWWVYSQFTSEFSQCRADPSFGTSDGRFSIGLTRKGEKRSRAEVDVDLADGRLVRVVDRNRGLRYEACGYRVRLPVVKDDRYRVRIGGFSVNVSGSRFFEGSAVIVADFLAPKGTVVRPIAASTKGQANSSN